MFTWDVGFIVLLSIGLLLSLAALVLGILLYTASPNQWGERDGRMPGAVIALFGLIFLLFTAGASFPWERQYHGWTTVKGTVQQVDKRMLSQTEKYVVVIDGQPYGCLDTRCSLIRVGDLVELGCKLHWEYAGTDGWDCKFRRNDGPA